MCDSADALDPADIQRNFQEYAGVRKCAEKTARARSRAPTPIVLSLSVPV